MLLLLGSYVIYDKTLNVDKKDVAEDNDVNQNDDWMDYILNSNIKNISIKSCSVSENILNINKEDLNKIFYELRKGKVVKHYYGGMGNICNSIIVNYSTDKDYTLELLVNRYVKTDDKRVLSLLELEDYTVEVSISAPDYMFRYDWDDKIISNIIDIKNK